MAVRVTARRRNGTMNTEARLGRALESLEHVGRIASIALNASNAVRDYMARPSYADEYAQLAVSYGELTALMRLIRDTARQGMEPPQ